MSCTDLMPSAKVIRADIGALAAPMLACGPSPDDHPIGCMGCPLRRYETHQEQLDLSSHDRATTYLLNAAVMSLRPDPGLLARLRTVAGTDAFRSRVEHYAEGAQPTFQLLLDLFLLEAPRAGCPQGCPPGSTPEEPWIDPTSTPDRPRIESTPTPDPAAGSVAVVGGGLRWGLLRLAQTLRPAPPPQYVPMPGHMACVDATTRAGSLGCTDAAACDGAVAGVDTSSPACADTMACADPPPGADPLRGARRQYLRRSQGVRRRHGRCLRRPHR